MEYSVDAIRAHIKELTSHGNHCTTTVREWQQLLVKALRHQLDLNHLELDFSKEP